MSDTGFGLTPFSGFQPPSPYALQAAQQELQRAKTTGAPIQSLSSLAQAIVAMRKKQMMQQQQGGLVTGGYTGPDIEPQSDLYLSPTDSNLGMYA